MQVIQLYTGQDRCSHFSEVTIPMHGGEFIGMVSSVIDAKSIVFGEVVEEGGVSWHNPPYACLIVMLQGSMEIEVSSGERRVIESGEILFANDIEGRGHITRPASEGLRRYMMIAVNPDAWLSIVS